MQSIQYKNIEIKMLPIMEFFYSTNEIDPTFIHSHTNFM